MIIPIGFRYEKFNFPCGEMHIKIKGSCKKDVSMVFNFEKNEDIIELLLVCNALKYRGLTLHTLNIPYVPFSRQDRINEQGECFSLEVFAILVNSCGAKRVVIEDPHSDVTTALIKNCVVIKQHEIMKQYFKSKEPSSDYFFLISPDGGALKKIYNLAALVSFHCAGVIKCDKIRNIKNGEITGVTVHAENLSGKDCYIIDDICDGGRTFIEIAKQLKKRNCGKIKLLVTHGFFTKGLEVFDELIDEVYTKGRRVK